MIAFHLSQFVLPNPRVRYFSPAKARRNWMAVIVTGIVPLNAVKSERRII